MPPVLNRPTLAMAMAMVVATALTPALNASGADPLRIGLLLPPEEAQRDSLRRGAETAVALFNATSSIPAQLVVRGRPGQWGDDGDEAGRLVLDDGVRVLIAPPGGAPSHLVLQVAGRTQTPVIGLSPDSSVTGAGIPWMVRLVPTTVDEARVVLPSCRDWLPLVPEGRAGREIAHDLQAATTNFAGSIGLRKPVEIAAGHLDAVLRQAWNGLETHRPAGILVWLPPDLAARTVTWLRERQFAGRLAGPRALRGSSFADASRAAATGFVVADFAATADDVEPDSRKGFAESFVFRGWPEPDATAVAAADAAAVALALLRPGGNQPLHLAFPLTGTIGAGLTGPWTFDRQGNRLAPLRTFRWSGTTWQTDGPAAPQPRGPASR